ncbi:unnamed protein product [Urochloa humidicola]
MAPKAVVVKMAVIFMVVLCVGSQLQHVRASSDDQLDEAAAGSVLLQIPEVLELAEKPQSESFGCSPACSTCKALCKANCSQSGQPASWCVANCIKNNNCLDL